MRVRVEVSCMPWRFPKIRGAFLGGAHNQDHILGSILGSPNFGKLPHPDL